MASKYVLDTHTLVWYLEGSPRLSTRAKAIVDDSSNQLVVPLIVLAEAAFLVERGRIAISSCSSIRPIVFSYRTARRSICAGRSRRKCCCAGSTGAVRQRSTHGHSAGGRSVSG